MDCWDEIFDPPKVAIEVVHCHKLSVWYAQSSITWVTGLSHPEIKQLQDASNPTFRCQSGEKHRLGMREEMSYSSSRVQAESVH